MCGTHRNFRLKRLIFVALRDERDGGAVTLVKLRDATVERIGKRWKRRLGLAGVVLVIIAAFIAVEPEMVLRMAQAQTSSVREIPNFQVDPSWPRIPSQWVMGPLSGLNVDSHDHVWIITRPRDIDSSDTLGAKPREKGKAPAPALMN